MAIQYEMPLRFEKTFNGGANVKYFGLSAETQNFVSQIAQWNSCQMCLPGAVPVDILT